MGLARHLHTHFESEYGNNRGSKAVETAFVQASKILWGCVRGDMDMRVQDETINREGDEEGALKRIRKLQVALDKARGSYNEGSIVGPDVETGGRKRNDKST